MTDYFDQLVEAGLADRIARRGAPRHYATLSCCILPETHTRHVLAEWRAEIRSELTAALAHPLTDPCPTCGGDRTDIDGEATVYNGKLHGCPNCLDEDGNPTGRVPASVRLMLGEQVGWYSPSIGPDGPSIGSMFDGKMDDDDVPVYRAISPEDTP